MPHIIETALLLLVIFVVGCAAGYGLRALWRRRAPGPRDAAAPAAVPPSEAPSRAAGPAAAPDPVAAQPAAVLGATPATDPVPPVPAGSAAPAVPVAPGTPAPSGERKDDLRRIRGVGPKIERALNGIGVHSAAQIAAWDEAEAARVDETLGLRGRIAREDWVGQARALD